MKPAAEATMVFHSAERAIVQEMKKPAPAPMKPPPDEMSTLPVRNWRRMSLRRAPVARRMPIPRVRSINSGDGDREVLGVAVRGIENGGHRAVDPGVEADVDALEIVFHSRSVG